MNTEILVQQDSDLTVILDEKGGEVTLRTKPHKNVSFTRQYQDGRLVEERLKASCTEKGWECTVQVGPGVTGIKAGFDVSEGLAYTVREAFVTIKAEPKPEVRWPLAPDKDAKVTLKQQAEQAYLTAVEKDRKQIEASVEDYVKKTSEAIMQAAASITKEGLIGHFPWDHFETSSIPQNVSKQFEVQLSMAKSKLMQRLLERLITEEKLTVNATLTSNRGAEVKLTASF